MNKFLTVVCGFLVVVCFVLYKLNRELSTENKRLENNQTALLDKANYYQTESGKSAASVQQLELSCSELSDKYKRICTVADELGIKVKRLQAASMSATATDVEVRTVVKDSIVYKNGVPDSILAIQWCDPWTNIAGQIKGRDLSFDISSKDTLIQVVHRVPRKFLFFRWGTKAIRQEITSTNPHTKITYTEYIRLK